MNDRTKEQLIEEIELLRSEADELRREKVELKQVEETLRDNEEKYRNLFENATDGIFELDLMGRFVSGNRRAEQICGCSRGELIGKSFTKILPRKEIPIMLNTFQKVLRGKVNTFEVELKTRRGDLVPLEITTAPREKNGKLMGTLGMVRDIAERQRAEEALRESEEKYRSLVENSTDGIVIVRGRKIVFSNKTVQEISGYAEEELKKLAFTRLIAPSSRLVVLKRYLSRLAGAGVENRFEIEVITRERRIIPCEISSSVVTYQGNKAIQATLRDITERKNAEQTIQESEEKYHNLIETAPDGIVTLDMKGVITSCNEAATMLTGHSKGEMVGKHFAKLRFLQARDMPKYLKLFSSILIGKIPEPLEVAWQHGAGTTHWGEVRVSLIKKGNQITGIQTIVRDITERKKMEEELELRALLLDNVQDAVHLSDFDGNIIYVNETACKSLGYSRDELLKVNLGELDTAEYAHALKWRNQELTKKKHTIFETVNLRKDGSILPVEVHARLIEVGGKKLALSVARDITERKQMEVERKEMEQKAQLASRLASVGEMASGVAHEINNPLVGVIGFAQLLMERKDLPDDIRAQLEMIYDGGQRVASIVKRLLSFARQRKPERTYVDIDQIIEATLKMRAYEMRTASIKVITQLDPELHWTMADAGQLHQVFLNLIINAEREMSLAHGKGNLHINTEKIDNTIRISFKDDGPGITKKNQGKIFDPFFTTREVGQGTGLGLSICHGIIAEHNGRIYVRSEPGKGANFIVELPVICEEKQVEIAEPAEDEPEKLTEARILVVDDEPINLQYLSQMLTQEGHGVETADNAGDALKKIEEGGYDLLLLDIKMPGMSGMELYKRIQKTVPSLAGRVVFITGDVMGSDTMDFLTRTKSSYITKPVDIEQLKRDIGRILSESISSG